MEENFVNVLAFSVKSFDLFGSNVLSLLKLENVFLSINNFQTSGFRMQLSDITSLEPSIFSQGLFGLGLILVVSHEDTSSSKPDFSSGRRSSLFVLVGTQVLHFWDVSKLEFEGTLE